MKMKQPEDNMELEVMRAFTSRKSDQEIGMPDVEQELALLKARMAPSRSALPLAPSKNSPKGRTAKHHPPLSNGGGSLRKIAAILVAALMLTGLSYAAVRTSFFTKGWDESASNSPKGEDCQAVPTHSSTGQKSSPSGELERGFILFKDVRLDSIMMQIDQHYQVTTRFTDESIKGIRMLLKWNPKQPLDEVLDLLNGFERLKVYREKDELIIENP